MNNYVIKIKWEGPFKIEGVIDKYLDENRDCGVYQVYGPHVLYSLDRKKMNVLLYIGQTKRQTFSKRFDDHKSDLLAYDDFERLEIYLGRLENLSKYTEKNDWKTWQDDVDFTEKIMIHKYLPSYNSQHIVDSPNLKGHEKIIIVHEGDSGELHPEDKAPEDFKKDFV